HTCRRFKRAQPKRQRSIFVTKRELTGSCPRQCSRVTCAVRVLRRELKSMSRYARFVLPLCLIATLSITERVRAQDTTGGATEADIPTAPVELDGTELLRVRGVSSLPAKERAQLIGQRLMDLAADTNTPVDALHVVEAGGSSRIVAGNRTVMTIID